MTDPRTSSVTDAARQRRVSRRAALRAVHPDLVGGDADAFIEVMRAFERTDTPAEATGVAPGMNAAATTGPGAQGARPVVTTTLRSRTARRAHRTARRLRHLAESRPQRWPGRHYAHLPAHPLEERA
ncbi:hypothetical protein SAMN05192575_102287 [Nocardioides alpinus]|uniref:Uncharacterized protein n=1 Tax=Nocardioides alpinus TaxID=748909 RepID=A0A1I0XBL0_9ACTN|nr:hypothetical protein [Nocardioides alpinus]PKH44253.1 hypothetical protein CXG46_01460 [Nocardioides alpinus]SFA98361.1 hypothetical protein SAMN05192575_102287 [Nocardioides alpinus]